MEQEDIKRAVEQEAKNGHLSCTEARALAERLGVDYSQVGKACNEIKVKIHACELGCF